MKSNVFTLAAAVALLFVAMARPSQMAAQGLPSYKVLYTFAGGTDGANPIGLAGDGRGNLYGITNFGGDLSCNRGFGCGTVFKVNTKGAETVPWAFTGAADGNCIFMY
jgi:hypothetical protein